MQVDGIKLPASAVGSANGAVSLGSDGDILTTQLAAIAVTETFIVTSQAEMLALTVQTGDLAIRTDINKSFILKGTSSSTLSDWQELSSHRSVTAADLTTNTSSFTNVLSSSTTNVQIALDLLDDTVKDIDTQLTALLG
jgi:hypothetical protein